MEDDNEDIFEAAAAVAIAQGRIDSSGIPDSMFDYKGEYTDYKGRKYKRANPTVKGKTRAEFDNLRRSFILDSIFISFIGLCSVWTLGTLKDAVSYAVGAVLG
jgi:hypothetical protein